MSVKPIRPQNVHTYSRIVKPRGVRSDFPSRARPTVTVGGSLPSDCENVCRLCLGEDDSMADIFDDPNIIPCAMKIKCILEIEVEEGDNLPSLICENCVRQLNEAFTFKTRCVANDAKLRRFLGEFPTKTKSFNTNIEGNNLLDLTEDFTAPRCTIDVKYQMPKTSLKGLILKSNDNNGKLVDKSKEIENQEVVQNLSKQSENVFESAADSDNSLSDDQISVIEFVEIASSENLKTPSFGLVPVIESTKKKDDDEARVSDQSVQLLNQIDLVEEIVLATEDARRDVQTIEDPVQSSSKVQQGLRNVTEDDREVVPDDEVPLQRRLDHLKDKKKNSGKKEWIKCRRCRSILYCDEFANHRLLCVMAPRCPICKKHFKTKSMLKRHKLIHTGEKPFSCESCDATFNQNETLRRHFAQIHGVKKYQCHICDKFFGLPKLLDTHIKVHLG